MKPMSDVIPRQPVDYPESDGRPMAETPVHGGELIAARHVLRERYRAKPNVCVEGNILVYYEEGNPHASVSPDVFVAFGVSRDRPRRVYKVWEEGRAPGFILEVSSKSTWLDDNGNKRALYAALGVRELLLFDPEGESLDPRLQFYRLAGDDYARVLPSPDDGSVTSDLLGVRFSADGSALRFEDAETGERLPRPEDEAHARQEAERARQEAERARDEEARARQEAEARAARAEAAVQAALEAVQGRGRARVESE